MKKIYITPTIEVADCCTEKYLLGASELTEVTTEGLSDDPVEQLIFGQDGKPFYFSIIDAW